MEQICIKVHGYISQATPELTQAAFDILPSLVADTQAYDEEILDLDNGLLSIHFEGLYFLIEDFWSAITPLVTKQMEGKLDYIDIDEWTLTRFWIKDGFITHNTTSLNQVMDFSGH